MKKILVVGDSHAAAIKSGVDILQSKNLLNSKIDFCAVGSMLDGFSSLRIQNRQIIVPEKLFEQRNKIVFFADKKEFALDEYDVIAIACAGPYPNPLNIQNYHCTEKLIFSSVLIDAIIANLKRYKDIVSDISNLAPSKIIILGAPPPSSLEPSSTAILKTYQYSELLLLYKQISEACLRTFNANQPSFLLPPKHLLSDTFFQTKYEYMKKIKLRPNLFDYRHGNDFYGTEIVKKLLAMVYQY